MMMRLPTAPLLVLAIGCASPKAPAPRRASAPAPDPSKMPAVAPDPSNLATVADFVPLPLFAPLFEVGRIWNYRGTYETTANGHEIESFDAHCEVQEAHPSTSYTTSRIECFGPYTNPIAGHWVADRRGLWYANDIIDDERDIDELELVLPSEPVAGPRNGGVSSEAVSRIEARGDDWCIIEEDEISTEEVCLARYVGPISAFVRHHDVYLEEMRYLMVDSGADVQKTLERGGASHPPIGAVGGGRPRTARSQGSLR